MKEGAGDDPFANDVDDEDDQDEVAEATLEIEESPETVTDDVVGDPPQPGRDDGGVPWVYTRANVKEERDMVQFYLRNFVQAAEDDFVDEVADELGTDVSKTDAREAAYVAAMRRPEIVADELERWGFESE